MRAILPSLSPFALCFSFALGGGCASAAPAPELCTLPVVSPDFEPAQGQTAFGVYLAAAADRSAPELDATLAEVRSRGMSAGIGELGCDLGAADALGRPAETLAVSVDFRTREAAEDFVRSWGRPVVGIAEFTAMCRD